MCAKVPLSFTNHPNSNNNKKAFFLPVKIEIPSHQSILFLVQSAPEQVFKNVQLFCWYCNHILANWKDIQTEYKNQHVNPSQCSVEWSYWRLRSTVSSCWEIQSFTGLLCLMSYNYTITCLGVWFSRWLIVWKQKVNCANIHMQQFSTQDNRTGWRDELPVKPIVWLPPFPSQPDHLVTIRLHNLSSQRQH